MMGGNMNLEFLSATHKRPRYPVPLDGYNNVDGFRLDRCRNKMGSG